MSDMDFMKELQVEFLSEASDLLEQTESCFMDLEKKPDDPEVINTIFRVFHNIKGTSRAVGFDALGGFAHEVENLLSKLRTGEMKANPTIVDTLLACNDRIKKIISALKADPNSTMDNTDLIQRIKQILEGGSVPAAEPEVPAEEAKQYENIGNILVNEKLVTEEDIAKAAQMQNMKLGEILVAQGKVEPIELEKALEKQTEMAKTSGVKQEEFVRLPLSKVDALIDYFGEQVIIQTGLEHMKYDLVANREKIIKAVSQLSKITFDLHKTALSLRMVSLNNLFGKMERLVRDTSKQLSKKVDFIKTGAESELDKNIVESLGDPLTHMIRNSLDHGLETPQERISKGKPETGKIYLNANAKGGNFYIEIKDDGKGLDKDRILQKAKEKNLIPKDKVLSDTEIFDLIFLPGFSTKDVANDMSGRGVGMDVVKRAITRLKGSINIESTKDVGTLFTIRLPLTLAIFKGTVVRLDDKRFIFPNMDIEEAVEVLPSQIRRINNNESIVEIKGEVLQMFDIKQKLIGGTRKPQTQESGRKGSLVLITRVDNKRFAAPVDEIINEQRVVLKTIGPEAQRIQGLAGGTILGDGKVALVIELSTLIRQEIMGRTG